MPGSTQEKQLLFAEAAAADPGGTADSVGNGQVPCHIIATTLSTVAACGVPRFMLPDRQSILTYEGLSHKIDHKKSRAFKSVYNSFNVTMTHILSITIIRMCPSQGFMKNAPQTCCCNATVAGFLTQSPKTGEFRLDSTRRFSIFCNRLVGDRQIRMLSSMETAFS